MPMAVTPSCTRPTASRVDWSRRRAGSMPAGRFSSWPMSLPMPAARRRAKPPARSRRWHWRRFAASTPCSTLNARSTARAPGGSAGTERAPGRRSGTMAARAAAQTVARQRSRQGHGLHGQALAGLYPLPRRRPHLPLEQRRRTGLARYCDAAFIVPLLFKCLETLEVVFQIGDQGRT